MPLPDETLAAWAGQWLTVACGCGRKVHLPIKMLERQHGAAASLPALVARLRCQMCGGLVTEARMTANPQEEAQGYARSFPHPAGTRPS